VIDAAGQTLAMAGEKQSFENQGATPQTVEDLKHVRTIDTLHQDEALTVLARYAGEETWTEEEEKKLVRRIDRKLISLLIVTYGLQYSDLVIAFCLTLTPQQVLRQGDVVTSCM
jgi:hypothetical protein